MIVLALTALTALAAPKALVLQFSAGEGVDAALVGVVGEVSAAALAEGGRFDVVSAADVQAVIEREAGKQLAGCNDSSACLAEVGAAMGANIVVHGSVVRLGDALVVTVGVFDSQSGQAVGRENFQVDDPSGLRGATRAAVRRAAGLDDDGPPLLLPGIAAASGAALFVGGSVGALFAGGVEADKGSSGDDKAAAVVGHTVAGVVGVVGVAVVVGAAVWAAVAVVGGDA